MLKNKQTKCQKLDLWHNNFNRQKALPPYCLSFSRSNTIICIIMQGEIIETSVLALNERGIHLLGEGDYSAAAAVFRHGLQGLRAAAMRGMPTTRVHYKLAGTRPVKGYECLDRDDGSCALFDQAFALTTAAPQPTEANDNQELLVVTLLYNMALAYDLTRRRKNRRCHAKNQKNQVSPIQRACALYEQVLHMLTIIMTAQQDEGQQQDTCLRPLLLATVNNRAVLALEMQDYDAFDTFRSCLAQLIHPRQVFGYDFFACNVLATARVRQQPAAAA